jgi:hypothetical protein
MRSRIVTLGRAPALAILQPPSVCCPRSHLLLKSGSTFSPLYLWTVRRSLPERLNLSNAILFFAVVNAHC